MIKALVPIGFALRRRATPRADPGPSLPEAAIAEPHTGSRQE
ncbi:hypothetical protein RNI52_06485 [Labrys neptuniae]|uniref:Uncharacterized protein n=1 Tax=Labrys neptuniae TaxID=376174 RepID=A0ABV3PTU0_9HYPH|nr:hypothetical protein [Labrys neptuniae]MDT3376969.1 hypothetical protein [Labrys neptuniae]